MTKTDLEGGDGLCTVICACLQKYTRQKRQQLRVEQAEEYINLRLYRVRETMSNAEHSRIPQMAEGYKFYPKDLERQGDTGRVRRRRRRVTSRRDFHQGPYINKREVTGRFRVKPGHYILIPSTYEADREGQFLIRIFTEGGSTGKSLNMEAPDLVRSTLRCTSSWSFCSRVHRHRIRKGRNMNFKMEKAKIPTIPWCNGTRNCLRRSGICSSRTFCPRERFLRSLD